MKNTGNVLDKGEIDLINNFASWNEHLKKYILSVFLQGNRYTHLCIFIKMEPYI